MTAICSKQFFCQCCIWFEEQFECLNQFEEQFEYLVLKIKEKFNNHSSIAAIRDKNWNKKCRSSHRRCSVR